MREVAIVSYAQTPLRAESGARNDVELVVEAVEEVFEKLNKASNKPVSYKDMDFTCSGSCDYLGGAAFAFVSALDALGIVPPMSESHVEMDAAWALYEAWVKFQTGKLDMALIYGFGRSSNGPFLDTMCLQLDPYYQQPLWPDQNSLAALQANACLEAGKYTEEQFAAVYANAMANAKGNDRNQCSGDYTVEQLLAEPKTFSPLRAHDCPPITDGASAIILCSKEKAEELGLKGAYITGMDHRIEANAIGVRDLTESTSVKISAEKLGLADKKVDIAEIHAPYTYQELLVKDALGLSDETKVNPSGGVLAGHIFMSAGLSRIGEVAERIINGEANTGVATATSGACLQQNLVAVLEGK